MDRDAFDALMASLDAPMVVVTASSGGERAACLVGFHGQSGIDPPQYAVWLSRANHTYRVALHATHVAVHFLGADDRDLASHFGTTSGDDLDKLAGLDLATGPGDVPLLGACPHRLVLERAVLLDVGGDHVCLVGDPVEATGGEPFRPLRLSRIDDLEPGHRADERPVPATERATPPG